MPWILFFFLGGALAVAGRKSSAGSIDPNFPVPRRSIAPYRLEDVKKLGEWCGAQCRINGSSGEIQAAWKDVKYPQVGLTCATIAQQADALSRTTWKSEADAVSAWIWTVIEPSFVWLAYANFIRLGEQRPSRLFSSNVAPCKTTGAVPYGAQVLDVKFAGDGPNTKYVVVTSREQALLVPGCMSFRTMEVIAGLSAWLVGYFLSPNTAYATAGSFPKYTIGANPPSGALLVGTGPGVAVYRSGSLELASPETRFDLLGVILSGAETNRPFWQEKDAADPYFARDIPLKYSTLVSDKVQNLPEAARLVSEYLTRSQVYAENVFTEKYLESDPGKIYFKVFGGIVDAFAKAVSTFGLPMALSKIGNLGEGLSKSVMAELQGKLGQELTSALTLTIRAAISKAVLDALNTTPLKSVLSVPSSAPLEEAQAQLKQAVAGKVAGPASGIVEKGAGIYAAGKSFLGK
jgi:hypothetical protein